MKNSTCLIYVLAIMLFASSHAFSQINHALTATSTHSGGGAVAFGYGPDNYNDDIIPPAGNIPWGWVTTGGWIEYTWSTPVTINSMVFYKDNRPMTIADLQYWDGTQYISFYSYNSSITPKDSISFPAITTTRLRMDNVSGSSNPNHREIQALFVSTSPNDAGVTSVDSLDFFCAGMQDVYATISNPGKNQIDSVEVHWEVNGVPQPMVHYKQLLDTINGSFPNSASVFLGSANFNVGSNNVIAYTSMPNGVIDTSTFNDTLNVYRQTASPPTSLITSNITTTSVDIDLIGGIGSFGSFDYEYGTIGFTPGTGTLGNSTTTPFTIGGLLPNTSYEVYIRSNCGGGDVSTWVGPFSFVTPCTAFLPPYTEDFNNNGTIPNCWKQGVNNDEDWIFATAGVSVGNGGAMSGSTISGGYFAYIDDSSPHSTNTILESPFVDVSSLTTPALRFFRISHNQGNSNVDFYADVWDGAAWNNVYFSDTNSVNGGWEEIWIELDTLNITGPIQVRFVVDENNGTFITDDVAIDDVSILEAPTCWRPTNLGISNITAHTANLSWTENNQATEWHIEYGPAGFVPGTGNIDTVTTNPTTITGLMPGAYQFYVRSICGRNDYSVWTGPFTFSATCNGFTMPNTFGDTVIVNCGTTGTAVLRASTGLPNVDYAWYDEPIGGNAIWIGDTMNYTVNTSVTNNASTDTFYVATKLGSGGKDSLTVVPFSGGNGCGGGNMFNINPYTDITIESFTINSQTVGAETVNVYMKNGTYDGFQTNAAAWTLVESVNIMANGGGNPSYVNLTNTFIASANTTVGIYIVFNASYTNVTTGTPYSNADLQLVVGDGLCSPFGGVNTGRGFNGRVVYTAGCESDRTMVIGGVFCTTGDEDINSAIGNIQLYPNPSNGMFQLIGNSVEEQVEVSIFNSNGKMVYKLDRKITNDFNQQIDLFGLSKGIYFVKLQGEKSMDMKKIIIQ